MSPFRLAPLLLLVFTVGCASNLKVSSIEPNANAGPIDGVPFRVPSRFTMTVYEKTKTGYQPVHRQNVTLPDPDRLFVLGFESLPLSNATVDFQMNADNTIKQVGLKAESKGAGFLTEAGAQIGALATARKAEDDAELAERSAEAAAVTSDATLALAADEARSQAGLAELQLENLRKDPAATSEALYVAEQRVRSTKLRANEAARVAGRPAYFPDVVP